MNVVMIVPTGLGAEVGGHSGDATPSAKLLASCCDKLFIHPNIVNASDINEMTENMLYVEGSILDRFLEGQIGLEEVYSNKILVAVNSPVKKETVNAVSAARALWSSWYNFKHILVISGETMIFLDNSRSCKFGSGLDKPEILIKSLISLSLANVIFMFI